MAAKLPELSYRLWHHLPDALPFMVPFHHKMTAAGFSIDQNHIKPVIRRNGWRLVVKYDKRQPTVTFHKFGVKSPFLSVDVDTLAKRVRNAKSVKDFKAVDAEVDKVVLELTRVTSSPH